MSEAESPRKTDEPEAMRPIPDGGLQQSMPEWLRRPPAWRNLPKKDAASQETATPEPAPPPVALPGPDTSEIDPRSLVDVTDLPQWLQDIAARGDARSAEPVTIIHPEQEEQAMTDPEKRLEREPGEDRDVSFEPTDKKRWEGPEEETKVYGGPKPTGMSQQMMFIIGFIALVIIVLILIAIF